MNYFELFNLPITFEIDLHLLEKSYLQLQRKHHPDRNIGKEVEIDAAYINTAYNTLKDAIQRAKYILQLHNIPESKNLDMEFLEVVLTLQETTDTKKAQKLKDELLVKIRNSFSQNDLASTSQHLAQYEMLKRF